MATAIPVSVKQECVRRKRSGESSREIYECFFSQCFAKPQSYESFRRSLQKWSDKPFADPQTLSAGTYPGFVAHGATVQVNADGEIVQAWIKQHTGEFDIDAFLDGVRESIEPYAYTSEPNLDDGELLEIPLADMHWGVSRFEDYEPALREILDVINERPWSRIVIPFGQDFFHNDSIESGTTSNGTAIEKVDMATAVRDGRRFMYALIDAAIQNGSRVKVLYIPGNHDRSISWMFMQILLERYGPEIVDDSFEMRKCILHGKNAIMETHGDSKQATAKNLAHIFPVMFPEEFAAATTREVHAGHLHHESEADIYGVMVRRLSSGLKLDAWHDKEDYVGTMKRFMLFRWSMAKLKAIYYI